MITERVSTGRRAPLVVLLVAAALVVVLAWKPWDKSTAGLPSPSAGVGRPATTASPLQTASPPTPTLIPPTPTPTPAPSGPPALLGIVECQYKPGQDGTNVLARLNIAPPYVRRTPELAELGVRRVAWRVELEINELESVFSADWLPVLRSRRQFAASLADVPLHFSTLHMRYEHAPASPTSVVRVVVDLEAFGRGRAVLAAHSIVALSYDVGAAGTLREGCPILLRTF